MVELQMRILVGSNALEHHIDIGRETKDIDFFTNEEATIVVGPGKVETFYDPRLLEYFGQDEDRVATLDELYTIKVSHIFWDLANNTWEKHAHDIMLMQKAGAKFIPELYDILYEIWEDRYGKKKANLNAMPEDFFKGTVKRIFDHDSIHSSIAYYSEPLFNRILKDNHPVAVDRSKFEAMSLEDKYKLVREEVYATALERQIIPSEYRYSPRGAYVWALKKTITSFSKGWFPLFIVLHLDKLWSPDIKYVERHKQNSDKLIKLEG